MLTALWPTPGTAPLGIYHPTPPPTRKENDKKKTVFYGDAALSGVPEKEV